MLQQHTQCIGDILNTIRELPAAMQHLVRCFVLALACCICLEEHAVKAIELVGM